MTTYEDAHQHAHEGDHHGPPPIHYSSRISPLIVGIFLFLGSEIMLFGSFFTVYFFDRVVNPATTQWPPEGTGSGAVAPFRIAWRAPGTPYS